MLSSRAWPIVVWPSLRMVLVGVQLAQVVEAACASHTIVEPLEPVVATIDLKSWTGHSSLAQ